ncbi:MAG: phosphomannomutase/phosphoglucomutase, partial [Bacillota bacterium]|nr:phosphomannomutase/phosphoglucomutase [Bacillota bacterium]
PEDLKFAVGRDSRVSGPDIAKVVCDTLVKMGAKVLDCGMATTPSMFMTTVYDETKTDGAIMITASHLPMERNGLKFFTGEGGLDKEDIKVIVELAQNAPENIGALEGKKESFDLLSLYAGKTRKYICNQLNANEQDLPLKDLRIAVDAGNGASGFYAKEVLERLGADVLGSQFLDPDGTFPNHQPNPENAEAMDSICKAVWASKSDLGIIFDTDGDRSAAVDENSKEIARNRIVALAAVIASEGHVGTTIVTDSITSTQLGEFLTTSLGLKHLRFKRGYKNVINKGLELNAEGVDCQLAIETSGHAAMKENYFLDDGAYLATKIVIKCAQLKKEGKSISSLLEKLEDPKEAKEFRFNVNCEDFSTYAEDVLQDLRRYVEEGKFAGLSLQLPNYEGVRVNVDKEHGDGWFLLRKSLHDPVMPLNIESNVDGGVEKIFNILEPFINYYDKLSI